MVKIYRNANTNIEYREKYVEHLGSNRMLDFHKRIPGYQLSPLCNMDELAREIGVGELVVKDESNRYGIQSFKGLGASYSIYCIIRDIWEKVKQTTFEVEYLWDSSLNTLESITFTAATDGNHGKAVAWFSKLIDQHAVIYMPKDSADSRIKNIETEGAKVVLIDGTYDDCVQECNRDALQKGWHIVSDTAYPNNMDRPLDIVLGYTSLFKELEIQRDRNFDYVIIPVGVGGIASAAALYFHHYRKSNTKIITVEPLSSDCMMESLIKGEPTFSIGKQDSIMAGLNCGYPSLIAWDLLKNSIYLSVAISDNYVTKAMRMYHEEGIMAGESGAAALAGLLAIMDNQELACDLNLDSSSILLLNTEGITNPSFYTSIIGN